MSKLDGLGKYLKKKALDAAGSETVGKGVKAAMDAAGKAKDAAKIGAVKVGGAVAQNPKKALGAAAALGAAGVAKGVMDEKKKKKCPPYLDDDNDGD